MATSSRSGLSTGPDSNPTTRRASKALAMRRRVSTLVLCWPLSMREIAEWLVPTSRANPCCVRSCFIRSLMTRRAMSSNSRSRSRSARYSGLRAARRAATSLARLPTGLTRDSLSAFMSVVYTELIKIGNANLWCIVARRARRAAARGIHPRLEIVPPLSSDLFVRLRNSPRSLAEDVQQDEKVLGTPVEDSVQLAAVVAAELAQLTFDLRTVWKRKRRIV